jgi:fermentation-respiration switch protein FrsA (DUF1100 family)
MDNTLTEGLNRVEFNSCGLKLIGNLYCPAPFDSNKRYSAIVTAGPMGTVKEQAAGVFAEKLSKKGYLTLTFDFRTQGESEGSPKNYENPFNKGEDIQNAISFLGTLKCVNKDSIGTLGICAGGSYVIHASVSDRRVKALATVNGFLSLREFTGYNPLVTDEIRAVLLKRSNDDRQKFYETGVSEKADILMPDAVSAEELPAAFPDDDKKDIFDYYYARVDRCWPNFDHRFSTMSYEALIKSHALDYAKDLAIPYLGVAGSEAITKPYAERFIAEILHDYKELKIINSARHVPTYANDEYVDQAIDALHAFYSKYI